EHSRSAPQATASSTQGASGSLSASPVARITHRACQDRWSPDSTKPSSPPSILSICTDSKRASNSIACAFILRSSSTPATPFGNPGQLLLSGIHFARLSPASSTRHERRKRPRYVAAVSPAGPPPTTTTSTGAAESAELGMFWIPRLGIASLGGVVSRPRHSPLRRRRHGFERDAVEVIQGRAFRQPLAAFAAAISGHGGS